MSPRTDPESFALGVIAGVCGLVVAWVFVRVLAGEVARARAERREDRQLGPRSVPPQAEPAALPDSVWFFENERGPSWRWPDPDRP